MTNAKSFRIKTAKEEFYIFTVPSLKKSNKTTVKYKKNSRNFNHDIL